MIAQGWTVPKIAHELDIGERQVYRRFNGAKCKGEIP
ncbi:MAG: helix-turn-helix domain-containing protein [Chitinophagaceae bacterium]|nr:helix-turn-helix domain-containing protein [Chitinophagaceae bacterium]